MSALQAGDMLLIGAGTYFEGISSNVQTIPTGNSWDDAPMISGYGIVILKPSSGVEVINLTQPSIQYVKFNGLILDASDLERSCSHGFGCTHGILGTNGAHHVRFTNIEVKNASGSGVLITPGPSNLETAFEFIGCEVHHNGAEAGGHGLHLSTSGNLVRNCRVHHNAGHGILSSSSDHAVPVDNNTIIGNDIHNNGLMSWLDPGLAVDNGSGSLVINNIVRGNKDGILVGTPFASGTTVSGTKIYNNSIYANTPGGGISILATSSHADLKNNIVYKNGWTIFDMGDNTTITNNLFTDPMFVDEASGNFELQPGSPAIDQGNLLAEVSHDFTGRPRPQLATHDLGAYEYAESPSSTHITATLAWDPSASTNVAGYKLYIGTAPGIYNSSMNVGNVTFFTISDLGPAGTYYFAVTAYNTSGLESGFSNEVSKSIK
jgi:hypothetical protein